MATESTINYGLVEREMGIGIYICSIPNRDFDTVCVFETKKDFNSYAGPSIPQFVEGIQKPMDALVDKAIRKMKTKKAKRAGKEKEINAIISRDVKTAVGVHFKNVVSPALANSAIVDVYKGYHLFIQNKPTKKYKIISKIKFNNKLNLDNDGMHSINSMLDSLIKKYEKNIGSEKADGLITNSCIEAEFIKLID